MALFPSMPSSPLDPAQASRKRELLSLPIEQLRLPEGGGVAALVAAMGSTAFEARNLSSAADIFTRWAKRDCTKIWTLAGSLFGAGLRGIVIDAVRAGHIDVLVCTGALIEQDMLEALGHHHYRFDSGTADDAELHALLIDRVYDHLLDELALRQVDLTFARIAEELPAGRYSSRAFLSAAGEWLSLAEHESGEPARPSLLVTAFECGVPIFVPALNDCSVGIGLVMQQAQRGLEDSVGIDSIHDFHQLADLKASIAESGIVVIGGGVPKNYAQDMVVLAEMLGHDVAPHVFGIQLSVADPRDGALSGSTLREAISWGKNAPELDEAMVWGEASITLPLLLGTIRETVGALPLKRAAKHFD